ncbi:MAG: NAD(P)/FAD-dependent oxidoreductase, partial [Bacillota bacterium]
MEPVIVIGGGAAGLMAAGTAAKYYGKVILIEKNKQLGKKLYITGKGRCNVTNINDIKLFMDNIVRNSPFLYSALYTFDNDSLINLLEEMGVKVKVERGGRVFPVSDKSKDIVQALIKYNKKNNVEIITNEVSEVKAESKKVSGVILKDGSKLRVNKVIVATGGLSYPETGSTGTGYSIAEKLGHTINKLRPSLVPLEVEENWTAKTDNLNLKNISLSVINKFKQTEIYRELGELTFTDYGIKGPLALSASSYLNEITSGKYEINIDLKPGLSRGKLDNRIQRDFKKYSRKHFSNSLQDLLPAKIIPVIIKLSSISPDKPVHQITSSERKDLVELLKKLTLNIKKYRPIERAVITSGGIEVDEINPTSMESRLIDG